MLTKLGQTLRAVRRWVRRFRVESWLLEGDERISGKPLSFYFAGKSLNKTYLANLLFKPGYRESHRGRHWVWRLLLAGRGGLSNADLVVVETSHPILGKLRPGGFLIPQWIGGTADVAGLPERIKASDNLKNDVRRIRSHEFTYSVTQDPAQIATFYETMYVPYISRVYDKSGFVTSYHVIEEELAHCRLLLLHGKEGTIAGTLLNYNGGTPRGWCLGVRDADQRYVKQGALGALYYFTFDYLKQTNEPTLHFGGSRPFLNDGALHFKRKWGFRLADSSNNGFVLITQNFTDAVCSFLRAHPFVAKTGPGHCGVMFVDGASDPSETQSVLDGIMLPGIGTFCVYTFKKSAHPTASTAAATFESPTKQVYHFV